MCVRVCVCVRACVCVYVCVCSPSHTHTHCLTDTHRNQCNSLGKRTRVGHFLYPGDAGAPGTTQVELRGHSLRR